MDQPTQTVPAQRAVELKPRMHLTFVEHRLGLTIAQLCLAVFVFTVGLATLGIFLSQSRNELGFNWPAIAGGAYFIVTASIGLAGVAKRDICLSVTYVALCVIGCVTVAPFMLLSSTIMATVSHHLSMSPSEIKNKVLLEKMSSISLGLSLCVVLQLGLAVGAASILCASLCSCCKFDPESNQSELLEQTLGENVVAAILPPERNPLKQKEPQETISKVDTDYGSAKLTEILEK